MSKNNRFFGFFLKKRYFAQHGQNRQKAVFSLFFSIFLHGSGKIFFFFFFSRKKILFSRKKKKKKKIFGRKKKREKI